MECVDAAADARNALRYVNDKAGRGHGGGQGSVQGSVGRGVWTSGTYCRECPGGRRCGGGEGLALCMPGVSAGVGRGLDRRCGLPSLH